MQTQRHAKTKTKQTEMHSDAQRNQHKVKTDQSKATQSKTERGKHQNRTEEKRPETTNDPFWRVQILTTIRVALGKAKQCKRYC